MAVMKVYWMAAMMVYWMAVKKAEKMAAMKVEVMAVLSVDSMAGDLALKLVVTKDVRLVLKLMPLNFFDWYI